MKYIEKKNTLIKNTKKLKEIIESKLNTEVEDLNFNVLCLGDFSSGKSTFINNFFLENKVKLPVRATTTTAKLTIVRYGKELKVLAVLKDGSKEEITDDIEESLKNLVASKGSKLNKVEYVEVLLPSDILKDGVIIVYSPGLNDPESERMDITYKFVNQADCVLYFMNAQQAWKKSEKDFLEETILSKNDLDKVFFLLNYWDTLEEEDREEVLEYVEEEINKSIQIVQKKLDIQKMSTPPLIPISAKTGENFDILKTELFKYLTNQKAENILNQKVKQFTTYINQTLENIDKKENILNQKKSDLIIDIKKDKEAQKKYQKELIQTENRIKNKVIQQYESFIDLLEREFKSLVSHFEQNIRAELSNIKNKEEFEQTVAKSFKIVDIESQSSLIVPIKRFKKGLENIFNEEKKKLDIPLKDIIDIDFLLSKTVTAEGKIDEMNNTQANVTGSLGLLSALISGGAGLSALTAPTVSLGFFGTIGASLFGGVTAMSTAAVVGVFAAPVAIILGAGYYLFNKSSKEKFQKEILKAVEDIVINLKGIYAEKIKTMRDEEEQVAQLITKNITNEFKESYQAKFDEYKEMIKIKESKIDVNIYKDIKSEISLLEME